MSITGSNNPFSCDPVVFANANTIVSLGTITRDGNEFTFSVGFVWKINGTTYQNTTPVVLTIAEASEGFQRIDNALLNTANGIELQQGLESDTIALQPVVPDTNLLLTSWIISGNTIGTPPDPLIGTSDFKGYWNANTNTPTLVNGVGNKGDYLNVDTQGTFEGVLYKIGDRIEYDGENWYKAVNNNQTIDISGKENKSEKGQANGYASLDGNGKVPESQLPQNNLFTIQFSGVVSMSNFTDWYARTRTSINIYGQSYTAYTGLSSANAFADDQNILPNYVIPFNHKVHSAFGHFRVNKSGIIPVEFAIRTFDFPNGGNEGTPATAINNQIVAQKVITQNNAGAQPNVEFTGTELNTSYTGNKNAMVKLYLKNNFGSAIGSVGFNITIVFEKI